jgi:uncharacterized membrane protein YhaH (DUF805 family)
MKWYIYVLKKYAVFSGRARRKEYWIFVLISFIIGITLSFLNLLPVVGKIFEIISIGYSLAIFIPVLAVCVRRLHDTNHNGLSLLFLFIPLVGIIILIKYLIQDGTPDENQYGINPKLDFNSNIVDDNKKQKRWIVPFLIILSVFLLILSFYLGFKSISPRELFGIFNLSNNNYYLNVATDINKSQFSLKKHEQINGVNYLYITKSGKHKLKGAMTIFQCERNDDVDIIFKMKDIFNEFKIVDEKNNVIWDFNEYNPEDILRTEGLLKIVFWNLMIKE